MQIEYINKNLINFLFWSPTSPLTLQNLELKRYFRAEMGAGRGVSHVCLAGLQRRVTSGEGRSLK